MNSLAEIKFYWARESLTRSCLPTYIKRLVGIVCVHCVCAALTLSVHKTVVLLQSLGTL